jgi:hypothetical protein
VEPLRLFHPTCLLAGIMIKAIRQTYEAFEIEILKGRTSTKLIETFPEQKTLWGQAL